MNPYETYRKQMVSSMTQGEMLLKLYDETLKQIDIARVSIDKGEITAMDAALKKSQRIVRHLRDTLDFRYPVSNDLSKMYDFFSRQMVEANVKKSKKPLDDIAPMIRELRDTFNECDKISRVNRIATATANQKSIV